MIEDTCISKLRYKIRNAENKILSLDAAYF